MIRLAWLAACLIAVASCGEAGAPSSLTAHLDGRINASARAVSQTK